MGNIYTKRINALQDAKANIIKNICDKYHIESDSEIIDNLPYKIAKSCWENMERYINGPTLHNGNWIGFIGMCPFCTISGRKGCTVCKYSGKDTFCNNSVIQYYTVNLTVGWYKRQIFIINKKFPLHKKSE